MARAAGPSPAPALQRHHGGRGRGSSGAARCLDRGTLRAEFHRPSGWADGAREPAAGDASFRKYFRLSRGAGTVVVMDSPAVHEPVEPFVRVGRHLRALGLSAPEILAEDLRNGFLLLEDLGDDTFARVLASGGDEGVSIPAPPTCWQPCTCAATWVAAGTGRLQRRSVDRLPRYCCRSGICLRRTGRPAQNGDRGLSRRLAANASTGCRRPRERCCCATITRTI